jgi:hypothetical protein
LSEHRPVTPEVAGSSPVILAEEKKRGIGAKSLGDLGCGVDVVMKSRYNTIVQGWWTFGRSDDLSQGAIRAIDFAFYDRPASPERGAWPIGFSRA